MTRRQSAERWRLANMDRVREHALEYKRRKPIKLLFLNCKQAARKRGLEFDITEEEVAKRCQPMRCEKTGLPLEFKYDGSKAKNPWAPSIDRKNSDRGYTSDNIQIVCWAYNVAKSNWNDDVVLQMATGLLDRK